MHLPPPPPLPQGYFIHQVPGVEVLTAAAVSVQERHIWAERWPISFPTLFVSRRGSGAAKKGLPLASTQRAARSWKGLWAPRRAA